VIICKINSILPLYKLDQFVNNFRKKYENIFIDVRISKEEYYVLIGQKSDEKNIQI
jgi:hypothetical protein